MPVCRAVIIISIDRNAGAPALRYAMRAAERNPVTTRCSGIQSLGVALCANIFSRVSWQDKHRFAVG